jgi:hypothetical protein
MVIEEAFGRIELRQGGQMSEPIVEYPQLGWPKWAEEIMAEVTHGLMRGNLAEAKEQLNVHVNIDLDEWLNLPSD